MLENLKKMFKSAEAELNTEDVNMTQSTNQVSVEELQGQLETVTAALTSKEQEVATLTATVSELTQKLADVDTQMTAFKEHQAKLAQEAKDAKLALRKEQIVAAVGTANAEALLAATQNLDDASFNAVIGAMSGTLTTEASTPLFTETGATATVDAGLVEQEPSQEMKLLKQKYQSA